MEDTKVKEIDVPAKENLITTEKVQNLVYTIRGQQVMLDSDLAEIYGYTTKRLNEQVARNIKRFPEDFMFQLMQEEVDALRSQFATANIDSKSRALPRVFTEQGVYMLTTVLKKDLAVQQSITIMRAFKDMRHCIQNNSQLVTRNACNANQKLTVTLVNDFNTEYPTLCLKPNDEWHDRCIFIDYGTENEQVYQCGTSSKDAGSKICSIIKVEKTDIYHSVMNKMLAQEDLIL